jgi:hypothetical protein
MRGTVVLRMVILASQNDPRDWLCQSQNGHAQNPGSRKAGFIPPAKPGFLEFVFYQTMVSCVANWRSQFAQEAGVAGLGLEKSRKIVYNFATDGLGTAAYRFLQFPPSGSGRGAACLSFIQGL